MLEARQLALENWRIEDDLKQLRLEKNIPATRARLQVYRDHERAEMEVASNRPSRDTINVNGLDNRSMAGAGFQAKMCTESIGCRR